MFHMVTDSTTEKSTGPQTTGLSALIILFALLFLPASAFGETTEYIYELPLTHATGTNARAMGMGGAYLAISNDGAALHYNPAGLARIGRVEFGATTTSVDRDMDVTALGKTDQNSMSRSAISALSFVYPFPTYQGSMVIALDYSSPYIEDRLHRRQYANNWTLEQLVEGTIHEWNFGYAVDMAENLSVGFTTSLIHGDYYTDSVWLHPVEDSSRLINDFEISGFTGSLGILARYNRNISIGMVIDLPRWIEWEPFVTIENIEGSSTELLAPQNLYYPFSMAGGIASTWRNLLITGDLRYTDWTQIEYGDRPMRYQDENGSSHYAYRSTVDLRFGAEYLLDTFLSGLRLRAGLAYEPVPYNVLIEDILEDGNDTEIHSEANYSSERISFSFGAGILLQKSMTVDIAYTMSTFTRELPVVEEDYSENKLLISAAFRMP